MSYYDEDYYDEPNEFEQQIDEFKDSLFKAVKQEHKDKMEKLEKENQELQEVKKNFDSIKQEYKSKLREIENEKLKLQQNAKRMRLEELFGDEFNVILYKPNSCSVYLPKCNKCDENRQIIFKSPSGKEFKEDCECVKSFTKYNPYPYYCTEFRVNRYSDKKEMPLLMWFKKYKDYTDDYDGYTYDSSDLVKKIYSSDLSFESIYTDYKYSIYFKREEDCQRYCNWLNNKNGITDEMTTDKCSKRPQKVK